jgi:hypothetical protein
MSRVTWFEVAACLKCCGVAEESKSSLQGENTQLYVFNSLPPNCSGKSLRTNTRSSNGGPIEDIGKPDSRTGGTQSGPTGKARGNEKVEEGRNQASSGRILVRAWAEEEYTAGVSKLNSLAGLRFQDRHICLLCGVSSKRRMLDCCSTHASTAALMGYLQMNLQRWHLCFVSSSYIKSLHLILNTGKLLD